jgi:hypothetical protein
MDVYRTKAKPALQKSEADLYSLTEITGTLFNCHRFVYFLRSRPGGSGQQILGFCYFSLRTPLCG